LCVFFVAHRPGKKRPDGGSGGRGGNVYLVADSSVNSLRFPTIHFNGQDGKNGSSKGATGRNGKDVFVKVPVGTIVSDLDKSVGDDELYYEDDTEDWAMDEEETDRETEEENEEEDEEVSYEMSRKKKAQRLNRRIRNQVSLDKDKEIVLVALGGAAGLGNQVLAGAKHQRQRSLVSAIDCRFIIDFFIILYTQNSLQPKFLANKDNHALSY
jgi:GTPase involved in cell partitioning and DNA repair